MREIKIKINNQSDRNDIVKALANAGYKVYISEEDGRQFFYYIPCYHWEIRWHTIWDKTN